MKIAEPSISLILLSLVLNGCSVSVDRGACSAMRHVLQVAQDSTWRTECSVWNRLPGLGEPCKAGAILPKTTILVYPDIDIADHTRISISFTPIERGLSFKPYEVTLDGRAPDQAWAPGFFGVSMHPLLPAQELSLDESRDFDFAFKNMDAPQAVAVPCKSFVCLSRVPPCRETGLPMTLAIGGLTENGRSINVPPVTLHQRWEYRAPITVPFEAVP